ncbi:hypothetical protein BGZ94_003992, partial [Podila epigama]
SLALHLDLLTAGSLFLLPSILPFLASALNAYTTTSTSTSVSTSTSTSSNDWNWGTTWIMALPCVGILIPLVAAAIASHSQSQPSQSSYCPWAKWTRRSGSASGLSSESCASQQQHIHGIRSWRTCPTIQTLQRHWWSLRGHPAGYGPLTQDSCSMPSSPTTPTTPTTPTLPHFPAHWHAGERGQCVQTNGPTTPLLTDNHQEQQQTKSPLFKRPRVILLSSLCFWTFLMVISSHCGLNNVRSSVSATPSQPETWLAPSSASASSDEKSPEPIYLVFETLAPIAIVDTTVVTTEDPLPVTYPEGFTMAQDVEDEIDDMDANTDNDNDSVANIMGEFLEIVPSALEEAVAALENDEIWEPEMEIPPPSPAWFKRDVSSDERNAGSMDGDVDTIEDVEDIEAMTLDPEDATVFHDFLLSLDAQENNASPIIEAAQQQDIMPCSSSSSFFVRPDGSSPVFEYVAGWTDVLIFAIAMSFGGVLVGLAQARALVSEAIQLHEREQEQHSTSQCCRRRRRFDYRSIVSCLVLSGSSLSLTILMILAECWDTPSVYFVGIGVAGMILVHAWVPGNILDAAPATATATATASSPSSPLRSTDFVNLEGCMADDGNEKIQVQVVSNECLAGSERRNACSLDESWRWEVTSYRADGC